MTTVQDDEVQTQITYHQVHRNFLVDLQQHPQIQQVRYHHRNPLEVYGGWFFIQSLHDVLAKHPGYLGEKPFKVGEEWRII